MLLVNLCLNDSNTTLYYRNVPSTYLSFFSRPTHPSFTQPPFVLCICALVFASLSGLVLFMMKSIPWRDVSFFWQCVIRSISWVADWFLCYFEKWGCIHPARLVRSHITWVSPKWKCWWLEILGLLWRYDSIAESTSSMSFPDMKKYCSMWL